MKYCATCKTIKNLMPSPYAIRINESTGKTYRSYMCRSCNTERKRRYRATKEGATKYRELTLRMAKVHREKINARAVLNYHIKNKKLLKPSICTICEGCLKLDAHHSDYTKPLDVEWLCRSCHANRHRSLRGVK